MKRLFKRLFKKDKCKHLDIYTVYICYQDRYVHIRCKDCKEEFYQDID